MKIAEAIKGAWRRALAWVDSREAATDEALRDAASKDWTARAIYGMAALALLILVVVMLTR